MAGNGEWLPPGGEQIVQETELGGGKKKKKGDRGRARRLGPHSFLFFVICAILSYFFLTCSKQKLSNLTVILFFPLSVIVCICFRHLARPRDSQTH